MLFRGVLPLDVVLLREVFVVVLGACELDVVAVAVVVAEVATNLTLVLLTARVRSVRRCIASVCHFNGVCVLDLLLDAFGLFDLRWTKRVS